MKGAPTRVRLRSPEIGLLEGVDRYGRTGEHRPDGMFVLAGPGASSSASWIEASVLDFAPSLARSLGVELPEREGSSVAPLCRVLLRGTAARDARRLGSVSESRAVPRYIAASGHEQRERA